MAMEKEILQIDGDASGAQRAAQQAVQASEQQIAAIESVQAAERQAADSAAAMAEKVANVITEEAESYRELQAAAEEAAAKTALAAEAGGVKVLKSDFRDLGNDGKEALQGIGAGADAAKMPMQAMASILQSTNPELAAMLRSAGSLEKILPALFGPGGLALGGLVAGLGVVSMALQSIATSAEEARRRLEELQAAEDRYQAMQRSARSDVRKELGAHGVSGEKAGAIGEERSRKLQELGLDKAIADQVAAVSIASEEGGVSLSMEDRLKLGVLAGKGAINLGEGITPQDTARAAGENLSKYEDLPPSVKASVDAMIEQNARSRLEFLQSVMKGSETAQQEFLGEFGFEGEGLTSQAARFREELESGSKFGRSWERQQLDAQMDELRSLIAGTEGTRGTAVVGPPALMEPGKGWADVFKPAPEVEPAADPAAQAEAKRREQVQTALGRLETGARKANLSPEEFLRSELAGMGATPEEIALGLDLLRQTEAAKAADQPARRPGRPSSPGTQQPQFDPDAQNRSQTVINNHYSGHVVIGDTQDPSARRTPRSPVR